MQSTCRADFVVYCFHIGGSQLMVVSKQATQAVDCEELDTRGTIFLFDRARLADEVIG